MDNPWIMMAGAVIVLVLLIVFLLSRRKKTTPDAAVENSAQTTNAPKVKGKKSSQGQVSVSKSVQDNGTSSAKDAVASTEGEEQLQDVFELDDVGWESGQVAEVSVTEVDDLTEYKVYKQFGYYDKAAESLSKYLSGRDNKPKDLVLELFGLYLESGQIDELVQYLELFGNVLERDELEEVVKIAFELDPNNLSLRVYSEKEFGWGVDEVEKNIVQSSVDEDAAADEDKVEAFIDSVVENQFAVSESRLNKLSYFRKLADAEPMVVGYGRIENIDEEERDTVTSFSSQDRAARLLGKEVPYQQAVLLYNRAINQAKRPASLIIDLLALDFRNKNIDNYAQHLWILFNNLGDYGRAVKEKMLSWGYALGSHPVFFELESLPNEIKLRDIGINFGFVASNLNTAKLGMLPLVKQDSDSSNRYATVGGEAGQVLQEAESALEYGQIDEAMAILENGIYANYNDPQLYPMLLELYERSENWARFEDFSVKVRSSGVELPDEIIVALSHATQRMNERG